MRIALRALRRTTPVPVPATAGFAPVPGLTGGFGRAADEAAAGDGAAAAGRFPCAVALSPVDGVLADGTRLTPPGLPASGLYDAVAFAELVDAFGAAFPLPPPPYLFVLLDAVGALSPDDMAWEI